MPSKAELEQDLSILEAELQSEKKTNYEMARELEMLRGQLDLTRKAAEKAGVSLAIVPSSPAEAEAQALEQVRAGIADDVDAIDELRNPPFDGGKAESARDIVRKNQQERAELQARSAMANNVLSRVAAAFKIDRWDEGGGERLVTRVNHFAALQLRVERRLNSLRKILRDDGGGDDPQRSFHAITVTALEWVLNEGAGTSAPPIDPNKRRTLSFVVNGHDTPVDAAPEHTLYYLLQLALVKAGATGYAADGWLLFAEDGARLKNEMTAREIKTARVIATHAIGSNG